MSSGISGRSDIPGVVTPRSYIALGIAKAAVAIYLVVFSGALPSVQGATSWIGWAASQAGPAPFGGQPYCNYQETLKDIQMALIGNGSNYISSVQCLAVEEGLDGCPFDTTPPNRHRYSATASDVTK